MLRLILINKFILAALDKNMRYCTSTPELLKKCAEMAPPVDEQE